MAGAAGGQPGGHSPLSPLCLLLLLLRLRFRLGLGLCSSGGSGGPLADQLLSQVWRLDCAAGTAHHVAGTGNTGPSGDDGPAKDADLTGPKGIALGDNEVFVVDTVRCLPLPRR